ncbi:MAG: hypothetical protein FJ220_00790, partial [Kiritimatiellaceae bacterium]|nr:hypothetical protein [Kiritimatiellaceae bacterium]
MKLSFGLIVSFFLTFSTHLLAIELNLTPKSGNSDGTFSNQTVQGRAVWVANSGYLYFDVPTAGWFTVGTPVYVRIEYLDTGAGTLGLHYDSNYGDTTGDKFKEAEFHTRSTRLNSGEFVYSFRMLNNPRFANRENGSTDFRLRFSNTAGVPFQIASLTLSTEPFNDARFLQAIQRGWLNQQTSPAKDLVDNRTLAGKVMTGYQGWFRTPSDVEDGGWRHWGRSSSVAK